MKCWGKSGFVLVPFLVMVDKYPVKCNVGGEGFMMCGDSRGHTQGGHRDGKGMVVGEEAAGYIQFAVRSMER